MKATRNGSAWAYSVFMADATGESEEGAGYIDLHSSKPEQASNPGTFIDYENPHRGIECTIVFKVQYVSGGGDLITVWLNPDLGPGASESAQPPSLITKFKAISVSTNVIVFGITISPQAPTTFFRIKNSAL